MIEPGSPRERVRQEANRLIKAIRDAAMRMIRESNGVCPEHGFELRWMNRTTYGCPKCGCPHQKTFLDLIS